MLTHETRSAWRKARRWPGLVSCTDWADVPERGCIADVGWRVGSEVDRAIASSWFDVPAAEHAAVGSWSAGEQLDDGSSSGWGSLAQKSAGTWLDWRNHLRTQDVRLRLIYRPIPPWTDVGMAPGWIRSDEFGAPRDGDRELRDTLYVPGEMLDFSFAGVRYSPPILPAAFFDFRYLPPARTLQPKDSVASMHFARARFLESLRVVPWQHSTPTDAKPSRILYPDYPGPVVVIDPPEEPDHLETYMIANTVTLVVLPDKIPLDASNIRIGLDIDSFAWSLSAELYGRTSLNLVKPDLDGPKTVELAINGWTWRFLVERYSGSGRHPGERYSIFGASRTQLLTEPYAQLQSTTNSSPINARQAADEHLLPHGFTLRWDNAEMGPPDWTLPAGAFSYVNQTPLQVVARLAAVAGGVVRPDPASDGLSVLPRYREAAWFWDSAAVDRIVPAEIVTEWSSEWAPRPLWNSVYVSGTSHGVGVLVRRAGSAGDVEARDVADDWMTGTEVARSRGICELSQGGNQAISTLEIPLFEKGGSAPGLIEPAMLCEVRDLQETWRGLCLGVEIRAEGVGASRVSQSLRLERHYAGEH